MKNNLCFCCYKVFISLTTRNICNNCVLKNKNKGREYSRTFVRMRDNFTCQICGLRRTPKMCKKLKKRSLDVHHLLGECGKKSRLYDKICDIGSLITVCHRCHFNLPSHSIHFKKLSTPSH